MTGMTFRRRFTYVRAALAGVVLGLMVVPTVLVAQNTSDHAARVDPVARMMDAHRCWSDDAPASMRGGIPGHAVVRLHNGGRVRVVDSSVGFGIWLDGKPGTLFGFCR